MEQETAKAAIKTTAASKPTKAILAILVGLAAVFVWRFVFVGWFNLIPDECSYWAWSRHLAWSYFDNSGGVAYLIRLSTAIFGVSSPETVRAPFLILSVLSTYLVYRTSMLLFGKRLNALLAALALNISTVGFLAGATAIHDNALIFCWMASLWATARYVKSENPRWFYVVGVTAGLAIQSKYTGVLVPIAVLFFLLRSGGHRGMLLRKEPWIGAIVAALFAIPIIWWNIEHDWASLHHILYIGSGSVSWGKRITDGLGYHLAQFLLVSPLFYLVLLFILGSEARRLTLSPDPAQALLLAFSFPLLLFAVLAFLGHVEANWALMAYPPVAILAIDLSTGAVESEEERKWYQLDRDSFEWAVIISLLPAVLIVAHAKIGLLPAFVEKRLGKADRIVWETRGWEGLGRHVGDRMKKTDVLAADSYQLCAVLEFNTPEQPFVRYLAPWKRPTQFDVWAPSFDNLKGRNVLFVSPKPLKPSAEGRVTVYENFGKVDELEPYHVMYHGETIRKIFVYRGSDFNPDSPRKLEPRSLKYKEQ